LPGNEDTPQEDDDEEANRSYEGDGSDDGNGEELEEDMSAVSGPSTKRPTKQNRPKLTKKQKRGERRYHHG
jgi:hypothetical protein